MRFGPDPGLALTQLSLLRVFKQAIP
jgi:hypothetical protein